MHARALGAFGIVTIAVMLASSASALPPRGATSCDLTGEWIGDAVDDAGTRWTFPMHVQQEGATVRATIEWHGSNGHTGTERVRGTIDCASRAIELQTESIASEHLVPGVYHATASADFRSFAGRWEGPSAIPGRFTVRRR
ncbi:hypothetical protein [Sandaracinus amylolyticus]|uniref:Uncharacterized protein n=1 Tax=Sandaracinus amylolyticus TaxID=927083 RepID=A0A0F6YLN5_9BACT|nr:hypothetical protein [Sandaracinus amylolyticus]AKF10085.1 hypothetical protein DB32_007234 [Sandaracinus amylolyticus]